MAKGKITINIKVSITPEQLERLTVNNPGIETGELLSGVATGLLSDAADGGMMIEKNYVQEIADLIGDVPGPEAIVSGMEKYARRVSGQDVYEYFLDPTWKEPLRQRAEETGLPINEMVQECVNLVIGQTDWLFDMSQYLMGGTHPTFFDKDSWEYLKERIDQETIFGTDIVEFIKAHVVEETPVG